VDNSFFRQRCLQTRSRQAGFRSECGLPANYFLCVARLIPEKNLPFLLRAFAKYRGLAFELNKHDKNHPRDLWDLVLVGDGPEKQQLESDILRLRLGTHVVLSGKRDYTAMPAYYGLAHALILPSVSDTWGLAVNEAMASGLPVLVSNRCGCAPDLVQQDVNGFTFDPTNVEELAKIMLTLWANPPLLPSMGSASQQIISMWGPERFASGLAQAVKTALEVGPAKATTFSRFIVRALIHRWRSV
jgi:glycosyltransferase involved in cell wall biosynthesis